MEAGRRATPCGNIRSCLAGARKSFLKHEQSKSGPEGSYAERGGEKVRKTLGNAILGGHEIVAWDFNRAENGNIDTCVDEI